MNKDEFNLFPLRIKKTETGIEISTIASWMQFSKANVIQLYYWLEQFIAKEANVAAPDEKEKVYIYRHCLKKVFENNGFLVQAFQDLSNLQYCYDNFIKHGFEVHIVGSDTLIIRNK